MILQHNLTSMFTNRQLGVTTKSQEKASEKLSTGYKINRAADDAAGLTISENMRRQIRGLNKASTNSQDALSFTQVADGAMGELQSIVHRVKELCVQGANDTNTDADREAIQSEIDALAKEVGNITENTEFNTLKTFGRDWECVGRNNAGEIVSTEYVSGTKNTYGLGLILGANAVSSGSGLDSMALDTSGTWDFTGTPRTNTKTAAEQKIKDDTGVSNLNYNYLKRHSGVTTTDNPKTAKISYDGGYYEITYKQNGAATIQESFKYVKNGVTTDLLAESDLKGTKPDKNTEYPAAWLDFSKAGGDYKVSDLYNQGFTVGSAGMGDYYSVMFTDGSTSYEEDPSKILKIDISSLTGYQPPTAGEKIVDKIMSEAKKCGLTGDYVQFGSNTLSSGKLYVVDNRGMDVPSGTFELISRGTDGSQISSDEITKTTTDVNGDEITYTYNVKDMWIQSGDLEGSGIAMEKAWLTEANIGLNRACVSDYDTATSSITICDQALQTINDARSGMGAYMNRFEHAIAIADNTSENVQSSESRIRDTDMADEMVAFSKANILAQAGQSMLAQANQSMQGVLSLLG